jgi:hypothetical protein
MKVLGVGHLRGAFVEGPADVLNEAYSGKLIFSLQTHFDTGLDGNNPCTGGCFIDDRAVSIERNSDQHDHAALHMTYKQARQNTTEWKSNGLGDGKPKYS